jgi:hypothetical protein
VYRERRHEIRAYIRGDIGQIQEAVRAKRFRALAEDPDALGDPERFRGSLNKSLTGLVGLYRSLHFKSAALRERLSEGHFLLPQDDALTTTLAAFLDSLSSSAGSVVENGARLLSSPVEIRALARAHDVLAEGIEDFAVCVRFAERLITNSLPNGGSP